MTASARTGRSKSRRPQPPDEVAFPVTPMLDMAFQLLAFFILTFQEPTAETHLDLHLPATPLALPSESTGKAQPPASRRVDADLENDLWIRAQADDLGDLRSIQLGESDLPDLAALGCRYVQGFYFSQPVPFEQALASARQPDGGFAEKFRDVAASWLAAAVTPAERTTTPEPATLGSRLGRFFGLH